MDELQSQLNQLNQALEAADEESRPGLVQLISDIQELLGATSTAYAAPSTSSTYPDSTLTGQNTCDAQPVPETETNEEDEFLKFQAEIAALESSDQVDEKDQNVSHEGSESGTTSDTDVACENEKAESIEEELKALEGMKCLAPFEHHWGQIGYYNSIILSVEAMTHAEECGESSSSISTSDGQVRVRVVFTQPVVDSMKPCEFFMEGRCRFLDGGCKFSHGEIVSLSNLREYREPDFLRIVPGRKVLAKYTDGLWYKAVVSKLTHTGECEIIYHSYKDEIVTVPIHELTPTDSDEESSSSDSNSSDHSASDGEDRNDAVETPIVWVHMSGTSPLGDWEKHTKGVGSRLMAKMGYILGTGLGKNAEGRVNPVDAVILPPGRSLDKCMELKEKAGTSGANLFSVDRRLKRIKQKELMRAKTQEKKQTQTESVFNFLNSHLNLKKPKNHSKSNNKISTSFNKETCKDLSKNLLTIGTNIKLVEKDITKCKESMKRHEGKDQITVDRMKQKLDVLEYQLNQFKNNEILIAKEQCNRNAKKKLALF